MYMAAITKRLFAGFRDGFTRRWQRVARLSIAACITLDFSLAIILMYFAWPIVLRVWPGWFSNGAIAAADIAFLMLSVLAPLIFWALLTVMGVVSEMALVVTDSTRAFCRALLGAVAAGDTAVAQPIVTPVQPEGASDETETLRGLTRPPMNTGGLAGFGFAVGGLLLGGVDFFEIIDWRQRIVAYDSSSPFSALNSAFNSLERSWLELGFALIGVTIGAVTWRMLHVQAAGFDCAVDAKGMTVRWRRGWRLTQRIRWQDARGLARIRISSPLGAMSGYTYVLDAGAETLTWLEPPIYESMAASGASRHEAQRAAAQRLVAHIQQRAGLTLYDLSEAIAATDGAKSAYSWDIAERALVLAKDSGDIALVAALQARVKPAGPFSANSDWMMRGVYVRATRKIKPEAQANVLALARTLEPYYPYPTSPELAASSVPLRGRQARIGARLMVQRLGAGVFLVGFCLVFAALLAEPNVVAWVYEPALAALPGRVGAEQPSYAASLTQPTAGWATRAASQAEPISASYGAKGYTMATAVNLTNETGDSYWNLVSWNPLLYAPQDVALSVHVALPPGSAATTPTMAGLAVDSSGALSSDTIFEVGSDGSWDLSDCALDSSGDQGYCYNSMLSTAYGNIPRVPVVRDSSGLAEYTLLLVRSGGTYLCYINGRYVGAAHDDLNPAPVIGQVGLYLGDDSSKATFRNLAIYPVPAGLPFWAR